MFCRRSLALALQTLGLEGQTLLVHSSLSSLGHVEGGAEAVVDALLEAAGPEGNVLFPLLTGRSEDGPESPPMFDSRHSACWTGAIPEAARKRPDILRSLHPTHSVGAIGPLARWLSEGHERAPTPCGFGSPYDKLATVGARIVLLGVGLEANTMIHHCEEIAGSPVVCQAEPVLCHLDGDLQPFVLHSWRWPRDYPQFEEPWARADILRRSAIGPATVRVVDAAAMRQDLVRRLLKDPLATLSADARTAWSVLGR